MSEEALRRALEGQARACAELGSPFTARLLGLAAARLQAGSALADRLFGWEGDITGAGASVPLRLAGALHALVLSGRDAGLAAVYPPAEVPDDALWDAVSGALERHAGFVDGFLDSPPQTNEIGRSAVMIAAAHWLTHRLGLPLVLSELGASAGLNLWWDRYALVLGRRRYGPAQAVLELRPENRGGVPPQAMPRVEERRGVDMSPIDVTDPAQALRLRAYVWPDQQARLERLEAALALPAAPVDRGDAGAWLTRRLEQVRPGRLHLVWNTVAWQYFPPETRAACTAALHAAGAAALAAGGAVAHLQMENDGRSPGAALTLRLWPGGEFVLGRADFHGRWLDWSPAPLVMMAS